MAAQAEDRRGRGCSYSFPALPSIPPKGERAARGLFAQGRVFAAAAFSPLGGDLPEASGGVYAPDQPSRSPMIFCEFARRTERVDTPIIQPAEPFLDMAGEDLRRRIFMTESETGASLCLRPEFTIPVCLRHIETATGTPKRYSYLGEIFRQRREGGNEFYQAGIEDLGDRDNASADARVIGDAIGILDRLAAGQGAFGNAR